MGQLLVLASILLAGCGRWGFDDRTTDSRDDGGEDLVLGALAAVGTATSFEVTVAFDGDRDGDAAVDLYYCNDTDVLGCDPLTEPSQRLTRGAGVFGLSAVVGPPDDPNDTLSLAVVGTDPDGVTGAPRGSVTLASSACVHGSTTFTFTGAPASFVVPSGCTSIVAKVWGAGGGGAGGDTGDTGTSGGGGGFARTTLAVTPDETLTIEVGGGGGGGAFSASTYASAGGGGGDLSGIRRTASWLVLAGGGGGGAGNLGGGAPAGGAGGGSSGVDGGDDGNASAAGGGGGGTPLANGTGGGAGENGVAGIAGLLTVGGAGGSGAGLGGGAGGALGYGGPGGGKGAGANHAGGGGGGGGGRFGGGGGGSGAGGNGASSGAGGAGGGGSGFASGTLSILVAASGAVAGNAADPVYQLGVGTGGLPGAETTDGRPGGNGLIVISY